MRHDERVSLPMVEYGTERKTGRLEAFHPQVYQNGIWAVEQVPDPTGRGRNLSRIYHVPTGRVVFRAFEGRTSEPQIFTFVDILAEKQPSLRADLPFGSLDFDKPQGGSITPLITEMWKDFQESDAPQG